MGQFKSLKQICCKIVGQFDLEDQGQGNQFLTRPRPLCDQYMVQGKIQNTSKLMVFTRNHTDDDDEADDDDDDDGTKNNNCVSPSLNNWK